MGEIGTTTFELPRSSSSSTLWLEPQSLDARGDGVNLVGHVLLDALNGGTSFLQSSAKLPVPHSAAFTKKGRGINKPYTIQ